VAEISAAFFMQFMPPIEACEAAGRQGTLSIKIDKS